MKKLYNMFFLFSSVLASAQSGDWCLFPSGQKTYYAFSIFGQTKITTYTVDSFQNVGNYSVYLFNAKSDSATNILCYNTIADTLHPHQNSPIANPQYYLLDSIVERNDTVANSFYNMEFYFLPKAAVGQSWHIINNSGTLFNDLQITCITNQPETFLGVTDSVKTFQLLGSSVSYYDTITIKLSKNYGLIKFIPFHYLYSHTTGAFEYFIKGASDSISFIGLNFSWQDFFNYQPGSVYLYKYSQLYMFGNDIFNYYRDSITQVITTTDSLLIYYDEQYLLNNGSTGMNLNQLQAYKLQDLKDFLDAPTNWISFGSLNFNYFPLTNNFATGTQNIYYTGNYTIGNSCQGIVYELLFYGDYYDTSSCFSSSVPDNFYPMTINTHEGIKQVAYTAFSTVETYVDLIGSIINGVPCGNTRLPLSVSEINYGNFIVIYPTPAKDFITIKSKDVLITGYQILNTKGQIIQSGYMINDKINIEKINSGFYTLKIHTGNNFIFKKLIKI